MQQITVACPNCQAPIAIEVTATYVHSAETDHGIAIEVNMQFDTEQPAIKAHKLACGPAS
jgi:hypothetical protein